MIHRDLYGMLCHNPAGTIVATGRICQSVGGEQRVTVNQSTTEATERRAYIGGALLLLGAALFWSLNGVLIKTISGIGAPPVLIAFYRSLFAGLILLPLGARGLHTVIRLGASRHESVGSSSVATPARRWRYVRPALAWCIVFFTLMTLCFVVANTLTEAANAIILQYTSTFWIFALSPLILRERARRSDVWVLLVAGIGILVIFIGNGSGNLLALSIALGAGLFFGLLTMMIRQMRDADSAAVMVMNNLGSALLLLPLMLWTGHGVLPLKAWLFLLLIGVVQFALPYYLYTLGLRYVPAYQAGLLTLLEPVLVPVWTWLALSERVPRPTYIGGAIILVALFLYGWLTRRALRLRVPGNSPAVESAPPT